MSSPSGSRAGRRTPAAGRPAAGPRRDSEPAGLAGRSGRRARRCGRRRARRPRERRREAKPAASPSICELAQGLVAGADEEAADDRVTDALLLAPAHQRRGLLEHATRGRNCSGRSWPRGRWCEPVRRGSRAATRAANDAGRSMSAARTRRSVQERCDSYRLAGPPPKEHPWGGSITPPEGRRPCYFLAERSLQQGLFAPERRHRIAVEVLDLLVALGLVEPARIGLPRPGIQPRGRVTELPARCSSACSSARATPRPRTSGTTYIFLISQACASSRLTPPQQTACPSASPIRNAPPGGPSSAGPARGMSSPSSSRPS